MIPFLPTPTVLLYGALAILLAGMTGYMKGCSDEKERGAAYKAAVKSVGDAQEARTKERILLDKQRKKEADNENRKLHADLDVATKRVRERARGSYVPPAAPGAKRPELAAFDRAELDRTIREFTQEVAGFIEQGDQARLDLDTVKRWAQGELK